jgi:hypothetical protein
MNVRRPRALLLVAALLVSSSIANAQDPPPSIAPAEVTVPSPEPSPAPAPAEVAAAAEAKHELLAAEPPASADEEGDLSAEELDRLGFGSGAEASAVDTSVKLSGFMDFKFSSAVNSKDSFWRSSYLRHPSMFIGNLNVYLSKSFTENLRTLAEVRFTYLPNGDPVASATPGAFSSTTTSDYADAARLMRWGGVLLERVYLEWTLHRAAVLRVGQYLTPYGIWNVDHGSPTIITAQRPFVISQQLFPERQTGLQLYGNARVLSHHMLGYALTLSNGEGPVSEYRDLDNNKAIGGRVDWTYDVLGELRIGGSWFYGRDTAARTYFIPQADGTLRSGEAVDAQSDVLSLAADLRWTVRSFLLQAEFISEQRRHTEAGRTGVNVLAIGNRYLAPRDALSWGAYGLVGYRLDWLGVMPYFLYTVNKLYNPVSFNLLQNHAVQTGLNIRPLDAVVLKLEYIAIFPTGKYKPTDDTAHVLQAQLAWAF